MFWVQYTENTTTVTSENKEIKVGVDNYAFTV